MCVLFLLRGGLRLCLSVGEALRDSVYIGGGSLIGDGRVLDDGSGSLDSPRRLGCTFLRNVRSRPRTIFSIIIINGILLRVDERSSGLGNGACHFLGASCRLNRLDDVFSRGLYSSGNPDGGSRSFTSCKLDMILS